MLENFGAYLKAQRELRGVSLDKISSETKIPLRHMEALEGNEHDDLPDEVFVKGYLKAYADSIGADVDEVLTAYDETVLAPIREEAEQQKIIEETLSRRKKNVLIGVLSVGIISGVVGVGFWVINEKPLISQPKSLVSTTKLEQAAVILDKDQEKVDTQQDEDILGEEIQKNDGFKSIVNDKPSVEPKTDEVVSESTKPKNLLIDKKRDVNTAETGNKSSEQKEQELASIGLNTKVKEIRASKPENSVTIQAHKKKNAEKKSEPLNLVVKAEQEGWFNLIVDGSKRKDFILPAGTSKSFRAQNSINLWIGNKEGTKLILNEKALELPKSVDNVIRNFLVTAKLLE